MSTSICRRMDPKSDTMTHVYFRNAVCIGGFAKEIRPRPNHVKLPFSENAGGGRVVYAHMCIYSGPVRWHTRFRSVPMINQLRYCARATI